MVSRYFHFDSRLTGNIHLAVSKGNGPCGFSALGASGDHRSVPPSPAENAKAQRGRFSDRFLRHFFLPRPPSSPNSARVCALASSAASAA